MRLLVWERPGFSVTVITAANAGDAFLLFGSSLLLLLLVRLLLLLLLLLLFLLLLLLLLWRRQMVEVVGSGIACARTFRLFFFLLQR